jgi:hypothetical protein
MLSKPPVQRMHMKYHRLAFVQKVASTSAIALLLFGCGGGDTNQGANPEIIPTVDTARIAAEAKIAPQVDKQTAALSTTQTIPGITTPFFIPPHTGSGDMDFNGHGPDVASEAELQIYNGNQLWLRIYMRAVETGRDYTTAEGTEYYYIATAQGQIQGIVGNNHMSHQYTDHTHGGDNFSFPPGELVNLLEYVGDTRGNEAGTKTGVAVTLHPITVVVN